METFAEYEGTINLKGHEREAVISYSYDGNYTIEVVNAWAMRKGEMVPSSLLKKRAELELPIFLERQAMRDAERRHQLFADSSREYLESLTKKEYTREELMCMRG